MRSAGRYSVEFPRPLVGDEYRMHIQVGRIGRNALELPDRHLVLAFACLLERGLVDDPRVLPHVDYLPGSDERVNQVGMLVRQPQPQNASPRMTHDEDLLPVE